MKCFTSLIFISTFFLIGCTKRSGPESVLKDFVDYRFKDAQSKDKVLSMLAGPIKAEIDALEGDDLKKFL